MPSISLFFSLISILLSSFFTSCTIKPDETPAPNQRLNVHFHPDYDFTFVSPLLQETLPFKQGDRLELLGWLVFQDIIDALQEKSLTSTTWRASIYPAGTPISDDFFLIKLNSPENKWNFELETYWDEQDVFLIHSDSALPAAFLPELTPGDRLKVRLSLIVENIQELDDEGKTQVMITLIPAADEALELISMDILIKETTPPPSYDHPNFDFSIPSNWQLMSDLWQDYQVRQDYYGLGLEEIVTFTSAQKQGEMGAYFSVAAIQIPQGSSLEKQYHLSYDRFLNEFRELAETESSLHDMTGLEISYRRPWGEPWWEFRDLWFEKDGSAYLLSFHAFDLTDYQEDMDFILASFNFK
jgi:hypothetical protein